MRLDAANDLHQTAVRAAGHLRRNRTWMSALISAAATCAAFSNSAHALTVTVAEFPNSAGYIGVNRVLVGIKTGEFILNVRGSSAVATECPDACLSKSAGYSVSGAATNASLGIASVDNGNAVEMRLDFESQIPSSSTAFGARATGNFFFIVDEPARVEFFGSMLVNTAGDISGETDFLRNSLSSDEDVFGRLFYEEGVSPSGRAEISAAESELVIGGLLLIPGEYYAWSASGNADAKFDADGNLLPTEFAGSAGLRLTAVPEPSLGFLFALGLGFMSQARRSN